MDLTGRITKMEAEVSGATGVKLRGSGDYMEAEVTGASKLMHRIYCKRCGNVDVSGVSKAILNVQKSLDAEVSGGSTLEYKGSAVINKISVNSISNIRKIN